MRNLICGVCVLFLIACSDSKSTGLTNGIFKATLGETKINVTVTCGNFDSDDSFFFNSDSTGVSDIDGDGVIVAGSRVIISKEESHLPMSIDAMSLEITVGGESFSAPMTMPGMKSRQSWTKTANGVQGEDFLINVGDFTGTEFPITYEVICE